MAWRTLSWAETWLRGKSPALRGASQPGDGWIWTDSGWRHCGEASRPTWSLVLCGVLAIAIFLASLGPNSAHASYAYGPDWTTMNVTAYCDYGVMADGWRVHQGAVAAARNIPFGSLIEIQGMGIYRVEDRGGAITTGHLDIWMPSCASAVRFGRWQMSARILRYGWYGQ